MIIIFIFYSFVSPLSFFFARAAVACNPRGVVSVIFELKISTVRPVPNSFSKLFVLLCFASDFVLV